MKERNFSFKLIMFYAAFALITIIFLIVFGIRIFKVTTFNDIDDVKRANLVINGQITNKKEDTYYVYIYSSKAHDTNYAFEEVEPTIFTYFTYVAKNNGDDIIKIYAYDVDSFTPMNSYENVNDYLQSLNNNLKTSSLPALVKISGGSVASAEVTINKITSLLQSAMMEKK